jgi:hypothetical protein
VERSCSSRETSRVRRQRSIEEWCSSEGADWKGADGGDAGTESGAEEGLQWRQTGEVDAWAMGEVCAVLGRGRTRRMAREGEKDRPAAGGYVLRGAAGRGGSERWAPLGGGVGEREGGGVVWSSAAAWHRCGSGSGPAAACAGGVLPRDSGERQGRRDAG